MTITIATVILVVALLTGFLLLLPGLARPTVPFGVRVPTGHVDAPAIRRATALYRRGLLVTMPAVTALLVALAVLLPAPIILTGAGLVPVAAWFILYLLARRTVRAAKRSERWYEGVRQAVATDTSLRTSPQPYPWRWAVPAIVVTLVTVALGVARYPSLPDRIVTRVGFTGPTRFTETTVWSAFALVGLQLLLTVALLGLAAVAVRGKADLVATAPAASADQYRRYAAAMARGVLLLAAGLAVTMLMLELMTWGVVPPSRAWVAASSLPPVAAAAVLVVAAIRSGQSGHRLRATGGDPARPGIEHRDDDAHWIVGLFYVNRDDPAILVPARFGDVGWKVNLAHPVVWIASAVVLVLTAASLIWATTR